MEKRPRNNDSHTNSSDAGNSTRISKEEYDERVHRWSKKSAEVYNNPFPVKTVNFIDWDDPEYAVTPNDKRWVLPPNFDLGTSKWYQDLPREKQIEIGMYRYAQVAKVGSEFEEALIAGIALRNQTLPSSSEEKRYSTHEAEEEQRHILMFNEMANRIGSKPHGAPNWFRNFSPLVGYVARKMPVGFWAVVLAGEEPIDHTQRTLIDMGRNGLDIHPMLEKVMKVHVAEEARHIGFADRFQKQHIDKLTPLQKKLFAASLPLVLRLAANAILKPSKQAQQDMGIPKSVVNEVWWNSKTGRKNLQDLFINTGKRADTLGLRNGDPKSGAARSRIGQLAWRLADLNSHES